MSAGRSAPAARLPGLDGLRAVAVIAVLAYHMDYSWARGGYLGVDLFFVLSGFLVTGLVLGEHDRTGTVGLAEFWVRRIRRLIPAQAALLLALLLYVFLFHRPELYELRGQVVAALTASTNWFLIATGQSYMDAIGRPPALRHLWSLAIEMQFYVVWPLVFVGLLRKLRDRLEVLVAITLGAAVFSALLMAILFTGDNPSSVYLSSFTRLTGLLFGAVLALLWQPKRLTRAPMGELGDQADRWGIGALVVALIFFVTMSDTNAFMYRLGFVIFSLVAVVLVAVASHPTSWLAGTSGLGHPVLVAIGARSYGIYLWHWPVFVYTEPGRDLDLGPIPLLVLRLVVTGILSELCFRFVERPWHSRRMTMRDLRRVFSRPDPGEVLRPVVVGIGTVVVAVALIAMLFAPVHKDDQVRDIERGQDAIAAQDPAPPPPTAAPTTTDVPDRPVDETTTSTSTTVPETEDGLPVIPDMSVDGRPPYVTAVGDSVMVGAAAELIESFEDGERIYIDGDVGRQAKGLDALISALAAERGLGDVLVIHIGTNGTFTEEQVRAARAAAGDVPVVFLNARAERSWIPDVNATLRRVVPTIPDTYLIDWHGYTAGHGDWFGSDGIHLGAEGRRRYAALILASLTGEPPA